MKVENRKIKKIQEIDYFLDEWSVAKTYHDLLAAMLREIEANRELKNRYLNFWVFNISAYSCALFSHMYHFFDSKSKARSLKKLVQNSGKKKLKREYERIETTWREKKYAFFRHNRAAHMNRAIEKKTSSDLVSLFCCPSDLIKNGEIDLFLTDIASLLIVLSGVSDCNIGAFNAARDDLEQIISYIKRAKG